MPTLITLVSLLGSPLQARLMEPRTWQEDFNEHTINGFFSYPATTDTAYDFTIFPHRLIRQHDMVGSLWSSGEILRPVGIAPPSGLEEGDSYLVRSLQPLGGSEQRVGVAVKPVRLFSAADSRLSFHYFLPPTLSPLTLHAEVAGGDGVIYRATLETGAAGQWHQAMVPRVALVDKQGRALPEGVAIEQFGILTHLEFPRPHTTFFLALDDVTFEGLAPVAFEVESPRSTRYRHWPLDMIHRVHQPGDKLELRLGPTPEAINEVSAELISAGGSRVTDLGPLARTGAGWALPGGGWVVDDATPAAPLELRIEGRNAAGEMLMSQGLRLWVLKPAERERPRLLLDAATLQKLRQKAAAGNNEAYKAISASAVEGRARPVLEHADFDLLYEDYLLRDFLGYFEAVRGSATRILNNAWVYAMEGDAEAGEFARDGLIKLSQWEFMTHPWFRKQGRESYYVVGQTGIMLGLTYDLLGPLLGAGEREKIRAGLIRNCVAPTFREYVVHNRVPNHTSNWIGGAVGGNALLLLSLAEPTQLDFSESDDPPYFTGLMEKLLQFYRHSMLRDGSYGEGYSYQRFAMIKSLNTFAALDGLYGLDPQVLDDLHLEGAYRFVIASTIDADLRLSMGDSRSSVYPVEELAWLIHRFRNPVDQWFAQLNPGKGWKNFLWDVESLEARSPGEAGWHPTQWFPEKGSAVLRNGWGADASVIHFRAGPNYNHTHIDQGHFLLASHGELLAGEAGLSSYYDDPYYWTYFVQSAAHNVMLVDGNPLSQEIADFRNEVHALDRYPRMHTMLTRGRTSMVATDLERVYREKLAGYRRTLVMLPSGMTIVHDHVRSAGSPRTLQFLYHPPAGAEQEGTHDTDFAGSATQTRAGSLELGPRGLTYVGHRARLDLDVHLPEVVAIGAAVRPVPYRERQAFPEKPLIPRHVVEIATPDPVMATDFLVSLRPSAAETVSPGQARRVRLEAGVGLECREPDGSVYVYLSSPAGVIDYHGLYAKAESVLLVEREGRAVEVYASRTCEVILDGVRIQSSNSPTSVVLVREAERWVQASEPKED